MSMSKMSENYYLRKNYLEKEQVPTQSVMKERMTPPLANVYFMSMTPKLKVLAGLEPPMNGAGSDWFIPPDELLKGRAVMKPIKNKYLKKLGFNGIDYFGDKIVRDHHEAMEKENHTLLLKNDSKWKQTVQAGCDRQWDDTSKQEAKKNTARIQQAFYEFSNLYRTSVTAIESLILDAAMKEIKHVEEEAFAEMCEQYTKLLKKQATMLYDRWANRLLKEKNKLKNKFVTTVENARTQLGFKIHDISAEKRIAIEKLRALLERQNLACQVYVAIKEREECQQHMERSKHVHKKAVKMLSKQMKMQDFKIKLEKKKEEQRQDFIKMWQKKVCYVVKKFQLFVKYSLQTLPEHADFFINTEKLMLLQLSEAFDNPCFESIFVPEEPTSHTPVPKPHPFYIFCDKGYKPKLDQDLCPKHCTSSASQFPVVVVNKRYIYAACDNFETFTEKVKQFLDGNHGDDDDLIDDHDYKFDIPFECTPYDQHLERKLQSSLMQVLQNEISIAENIRRRPKSPRKFAQKKIAQISSAKSNKVRRIKNKNRGIEIKSRDEELEHEREPKWDSYFDYITRKRCKCAKRAKKHLEEHIPAYMRNVSPFVEPELPFYKTCTVHELKQLVKDAQARPSPLPTPVKVESKIIDVGTQYSDQQFDFMCTCFSDDEIKNVFESSRMRYAEQQFKIVDGSVSAQDLQKEQRSFAQDRARSLRRLIDVVPELEEIFKKQDCDF